MPTVTQFPVTTKPISSEPVAIPTRLSNLLGISQSGAVEQYPIGSILNNFDVRSFGVVADGVTDDSFGVQACFAAAPAGSVIDFPPGGTVLMRSFVTPPNDFITVRGNNCKIISDATGQDRKFNCVGRTGLKFSKLRIDGLSLTDEVASVAPVIPVWDTFSPRNRPGTIHFKDCTDCDVYRCRFDGVNWPVTLLGKCNIIRIDHNTFSQYYAGVYSYVSDDLGANEDLGHPQPRRVSVTNNDFLPGRYQAWQFERGYGKYDDRDYTFDTPPYVTYGGAGAVKFRGEQNVYIWGKPWNVATCNKITGNTIRDPGQMGIEVQGCVNDTIVSHNNISSCSIAGVSLSVVQRVIVSDNTIKDCIYTCIECDGWENEGVDGENDGNNNDEIIIADNIMDGRDDFGRPVNWVDNYGIVVSSKARNVTITGGVSKYNRSGVVIKPGSRGVKISGMKIITNAQSGYGGYGPYADGNSWAGNFVQGILVNQSTDVDITDCHFETSANAWQRMVNIWASTDVRVRGCTIKANNACVYISASSGILVESNILQIDTVLGGVNPGFIAIDSASGDCTNIVIRSNFFKGVGTVGIVGYCSANTLGGILVDRNDTRFASCTNANFLDIGAWGTGTLGQIITRDNIGGSDEQRAIDIPVKRVAGTDGPFADNRAYTTLRCEYDTTINLQPDAVDGKTKTIIMATGNTVNIIAAPGQTINELTEIQLTMQWQKVSLQKFGNNWIII